MGLGILQKPLLYMYVGTTISVHSLFAPYMDQQSWQSFAACIIMHL